MCLDDDDEEEEEEEDDDEGMTVLTLNPGN